MSGDIVHLDIEEPEEPEEDGLLLEPGQAVVINLNRTGAYIPGIISGVDHGGLLVNCYWKSEEGISHTGDSYVPWTSIESVDLHNSVNYCVKVVLQDLTS